MTIIFLDTYDTLLTEYLPPGTTISDFYYASIIELLRCPILEKRGGKVNDGVLLHGHAPVHKCNIIPAAIRKVDFVELNHPAYSPDVALSDYYLFSNFNKFLCGKNFSRDDETIDTAEDYLNNLD